MRLSRRTLSAVDDVHLCMCVRARELAKMHGA